MDELTSPGPGAHPPRPSELIDEICDRFEAAWRAGRAPRIVEYLPDVAQADRPALLGELVALERELRRGRGEQPGVEDYLEAFPEYAEVVHAAFEATTVSGGTSGARREQTTGRNRPFRDLPDPERFSAPSPDLRAGWLPQAEIHDWWARAGVSADGSSEDRGLATPDSSGHGEAIVPPRPDVGPAAPNPPSSQGLPAGLVLGDYQIQDQIGRGGMGEVYQALHLRLGRKAALKVIVPLYLSSEEMMARFYREMRAIGRLDHPHLVRATDARQVDQRHILVMELLDGLNLKVLVDRVGPLPLADSCEMIRQAAEGLEHAHQHGIVHRDIKPSNLMLIRGGTIKVLDLGLARLQEGEADALTPSHLAVGTPDYVAPEQITDPRAVSPRSDLYGLGCTLYHLLVGRPPFHGSRSPFDKMLSHQQAPIPPIRHRRPELPEGLVGLLDRMLAKDPMGRPGSAQEVVESLGPWGLGADLPGLLDRALHLGPPASSSRAGIVSTEDDRDAGVAGPAALPSRAASPRKSEECSGVTGSSPGGERARPRRWVLPTLTLAAVSLLGFLAAWRFVVPPHPNTPPSPIPVPAAGPLTVTSLSVRHFRAMGLERLDDLDLIGASGEAVRVGDDVRVEVQLSEPAYAYLLALNTNGTVQLALPASDALPPPRTDLLVFYPDQAEYFTLNEGRGVQAFVAVASRRILPAYRDWRSGPAALRWGHTEAAGIWRYDGQQFVLVSRSGKGLSDGTRGTKTRRVPEPFEAACRILRDRTGIDAVAAIAFPVLPAEGR